MIMKSARTIVCIALSICVYALPILAAVPYCQCYSFSNCPASPPPNCMQVQGSIFSGCKQFCSTQCASTQNPNNGYPTYQTGCCQYTQTSYSYTSSGGTCNAPADCIVVSPVTYSATKTCTLNGSAGSCLEVLSGGTCQ
jgi:hypothetical protein